MSLGHSYRYFLKMPRLPRKRCRPGGPWSSSARLRNRSLSRVALPLVSISAGEGHPLKVTRSGPECSSLTAGSWSTAYTCSCFLYIFLQLAAFRTDADRLGSRKHGDEMIPQLAIPSEFSSNRWFSPSGILHFDNTLFPQSTRFPSLPFVLFNPSFRSSLG